MRPLHDRISHAMPPARLRPETHDLVLNNLAKGFGKRAYQIEALSRFVFYMENENFRTKPAQLLFQMATGSGKTWVMAACMLYLYQKGYRHFVFFVNSTNIIGKTRDNFLNPHSSKYLFGERIAFGEKEIKIKETENFQAPHGDDINIVFSTIQGLHAKLNAPKENSVTYDDFSDQSIVLISDEAHHINAETKKGKPRSKEEAEEALSWEGTVNRIFTSNRENILLEFTATADMGDPGIQKKYFDKLLFDYPLRQFRADGYSKEVNVLQSGHPEMDRALAAIVLSQYRRKVFEKHGKPVKPVILFKSRTIRDSQVFLLRFGEMIKNLRPSHFRKIKQGNESPAIKRAFGYFEENNIGAENLVEEIRNDFSPEKCISVNSKEESDEKQIAINTLEDGGNRYRAVFAVDKLNEGWDVLNLFDIVRLYDTRDAARGKPGKTTVSEAQLIGRGARYFPFQLNGKQPMFSRKFDADPGNERRICEELFYHSAYNPRYIAELNTALEDIGIKPTEAEQAKNKTGPLSHDAPKKNASPSERERLPTLKPIYRIQLMSGLAETPISVQGPEKPAMETRRKVYAPLSLGPHILRKAINKLGFYRFDNLKKYLPALASIAEFIASEKYLGKVKVEVEGAYGQTDHLSAQEKLRLAVRLLESIAPAIASIGMEPPATGTKNKEA